MVRIATWLVTVLTLALAAVPALGQAPSTFVFTNNDNYRRPNSVSGFRVGTNGALTPVPGSPFLTLGYGSDFGDFSTSGIAVTSKYLYVANDGDFLISGFSVDPNSGFLTQLPSSPYVPGGPLGDGFSLAASQDDRFLYVSTFNTGAISAYRIAADGSLSHLPGSPVMTDFRPADMKLTSDGRHLVLASREFGAHVASFNINLDGSVAPTPKSVVTISDEIASLTVNQAGTRVYGTSRGFPSKMFGFDLSSGGTLTALPGAPFPLDGDFRYTFATYLSPNENHLFCSQRASEGDRLAVFSITSGGAVLSAPAFDYAFPGISPYGMDTNAAGTFLFVSGGLQSRSVSAFEIGSNGSLGVIPGTPFSIGVEDSGGPQSLVCFPRRRASPPGTGERVCLVDDATGDSFYEVVNAASPLYGSWGVHVQSLNLDITGRANVVRYARGRSLVSSDTDYGSDNPAWFMSVNVNFGAGTGVVQLRNRFDGRQIVLRDRRIADNPPCG